MRKNLVLIGSCVILLAGVVAGAVWLEDRAKWWDVSCGELPPGREEWRKAGTGTKEKIADGLVRCETLIGSSEAEVERVFGPVRVRGGQTNVLIGTVNDSFGPGDAQGLRLRYGPEGRVTEAELWTTAGD